MNNKVKDIIDHLIKCKNEDKEMNYQPEDILTIKDVWLLLDCITNLQEENKQLKEELKNKPDTKWTIATEDGKEYTIIQSERIDMQEELNKTNTKLFNQLKNKDSILTELEETIKHKIKGFKENKDYFIDERDMYELDNLIQELKEKYK